MGQKIHFLVGLTLKIYGKIVPQKETFLLGMTRSEPYLIRMRRAVYIQAFPIGKIWATLEAPAPLSHVVGKLH